MAKIQTEITNFFILLFFKIKIRVFHALMRTVFCVCVNNLVHALVHVAEAQCDHREGIQILKDYRVMRIFCLKIPNAINDYFLYLNS